MSIPDGKFADGSLFRDDVARSIPQRGQMAEDSRNIIEDRTPETLFAGGGAWFLNSIIARLTRDHETLRYRPIAMALIIT